MASLALKKRLKEKRGVALIETAIVMLLLILITFGIMEYSWLFHRIQQMNGIARAGARQAVLPDSTLLAVQTSVQAVANAHGIYGYTMTITPGDIVVLGSGELITVTVEVPYENVKLLGGALFPMPSPLRAAVTMAKEGGSP